jgi:hypothetical protein
MNIADFHGFADIPHNRNTSTCACLAWPAAQVQFRFEFAQNRGGICSDVRPTHTDCGVSVDNIVLNSVVSAPSQP